MGAKTKEGQELKGNGAVIRTDQRIPSPAGTTLLLGLTCCHKFSKPATTLSHSRKNKTNFSSCSVSLLEQKFSVSVELVPFFDRRIFQRVMEKGENCRICFFVI